MSAYQNALEKIRNSGKEQLTSQEVLSILGDGVKDLVGEMNRSNQSRSDRLGGDVAACQSKLEKFKAALDDAYVRLDRMETYGGGAVAPTNREKLLPFAAGFMANALRRPVREAEIDWDAINQYQQAFQSYLRLGLNSMPNEYRAAMQVGSDPDGGFWVPPQLSMTIIERLSELSPMRRLASVETIASDHLELPVDSGSLVSGGWIGETEARPETASPQVGLQNIYVREQYAQPKLTQKFLDDAALNVEDWLSRKIASKLAEDESASFVTGSGVKMPRGFLDYKTASVPDDDATRPWGKLQYIPSGQSGGFKSGEQLDCLVQMTHSMKAPYHPGSVWLMARATGASLRTVKDSTGRFLWGDSMTEEGRPQLLGFPVHFEPSMDAMSANSFPIAFANVRRGYQILDHISGIRVLRDNLTQKGFVLFYTTKRTGGDVVDTDAIKLLKLSVS